MKDRTNCLITHCDPVYGWQAKTKQHYAQKQAGPLLQTECMVTLAAMAWWPTLVENKSITGMLVRCLLTTDLCPSGHALLLGAVNVQGLWCLMLANFAGRQDMQYQHLWVLQDGSGNGNALLLPPGHLHPSLPNCCVIPTPHIPCKTHTITHVCLKNACWSNCALQTR